MSQRDCTRNNCHIYSLLWAVIGVDEDPSPEQVCNVTYDILDRDVSTSLEGVGSAIIESTFVIGTNVYYAGIGGFEIGTTFIVG